MELDAIIGQPPKPVVTSFPSLAAITSHSGSGNHAGHHQLAGPLLLVPPPAIIGTRPHCPPAMHVAGDSTSPPELLDEFIDQIDETSTLLVCSLVSQRVLVKSRRRLFSALEFSSDVDFDRFLDLAGAPWTSFTSAVQEIRLQDLFHSIFEEYTNGSNSKTVASNLCNVKTLSIFLHSRWKCGWRQVPPSVLGVIFKLKIHDLQLDGVGMTKAEDMAILFDRLSPTLKTLAFRMLRFDELENSGLSDHLSIFRRPLHFRMLDNFSLVFLKDVLDPLTNTRLDVTVQTFHIRVPPAEVYNPLTWRFLEHIGHGVEQLLVTFTEPYNVPRGKLPFVC